MSRGKSTNPTKTKPYVFVGKFRNENMPPWIERCATLKQAQDAARNFYGKHTEGSILSGTIIDENGKHVFNAAGDYLFTVPAAVLTAIHAKPVPVPKPVPAPDGTLLSRLDDGTIRIHIPDGISALARELLVYVANGYGYAFERGQHYTAQQVADLVAGVSSHRFTQYIASVMATLAPIEL